VETVIGSSCAKAGVTPILEIKIAVKVNTIN
jgi:hypothetical protein